MAVLFLFGIIFKKSNSYLFIFKKASDTYNGMKKIDDGFNVTVTTNAEMGYRYVNFQRITASGECVL